jgi:hypothetical protein
MLTTDFRKSESAWVVCGAADAEDDSDSCGDATSTPVSAMSVSIGRFHHTAVTKTTHARATVIATDFDAGVMLASA